MAMAERYNNIRTLIGNNKIDEAISLLSLMDEIINDKEYSNDLQLLKFRYRQIKRMYRQPFSEKKECDRELLKLADNILSLLNELEQNSLTKKHANFT